MKLSNRFVIVGVLLALVLAAGVTWVFAQSAEIHACVNAGGVPRIVEGPDDCRAKETHLQWNVQGLPGADGADGEQGPPGPQGPAGPQGVLGFYRVYETFTIPKEGWGTGLGRPTCDPGDYVMGGGFKIDQDLHKAFESWPTTKMGTTDTWQWFVRVISTAAEETTAQGWAMCADVTP